MANLDFGRLLKILAMTTSSNDGEALNAIRMANKILAEAKVTWKQIITPSNVTGSTIYGEDIFRDTAESVRRHREEARFNADFNTDHLRRRQEARDAQYEKTYEYRTGYEDPEMTGWRTKGPFNFGGEETKVDAALQAELDADEMSRDLSDEQQQANFYVFAVVEPALAKFLHKNKNGAMLMRVLHRTVCETGDISEQQKMVLRQRMQR